MKKSPSDVMTEIKKFVLEIEEKKKGLFFIKFFIFFNLNRIYLFKYIYILDTYFIKMKNALIYYYIFPFM